ncbi:MAG: hypothetical protein AB4911_05570 [Oscillochloridaceae bacterium umkhey_bin13]
MIVTLVEDIAEKLALEDRLKTNQAEIKSIEATLRALDKVAKTVREFTDQLEVCSPCLEAQAVADIRSQVQLVGQELAVSRQRFATNRKEWLGIQKAESNLQRPIKDLADRWQSYANGRLSPYRDLMRLVNYLPECADKVLTEQARNLAQTADMAVIFTGCVKHALTYGIGPYVRDPVYPASVGSTSILRAIEARAKRPTALETPRR